MGLGKIFLNTFAKRQFQTFWEYMYYLSLKGMNVGGGDLFEESGEREAVIYLRNKKIISKSPVIFDVGANVGGYALAIKRILPSAIVHCFEPGRETFASLKRNVKNGISGRSGEVFLNNVGLSDIVQKGTLFYDEEGSGLASLYDRQLDYVGINFGKSEEVELDTIDSYCSRREIDFIDFLKMDIEGNELRAIDGASKMISGGNIQATQIEFGGGNIDSRTYFRDFYNRLHSDYFIYRIVKNGLWEILKYDERMEIFSCTNYIFVKKNQTTYKL